MKFRYEHNKHKVSTVWTLCDGTEFINPESLEHIQIHIENRIKELQIDLKEVKLSIEAAAGSY